MPNEATHPGASDMVLALPSGVSGPTKAQFYPKATIKSLSPNPAETSTHPHYCSHWPRKPVSAGRAQSKVVQELSQWTQKGDGPCSLRRGPSLGTACLYSQRPLVSASVLGPDLGLLGLPPGYTTCHRLALCLGFLTCRIGDSYQIVQESSDPEPEHSRCSETVGLLWSSSPT